MLNILVSNDDGVSAPGIRALAAALSAVGTVTVVAPDSERSGFSSALTLDRPLRPIQLSERVWAVNGTPADCVYLALNGLFEEPFDLVVSGINSGANLGDDVLYSGTVGAAFEGRLMRLPAIAVSLVGPNVRHYQLPESYEAAANWVAHFIQSGLPCLPPRHIFNINIPDTADLKGYQVTRTGVRGQSKPIAKGTDPRGHQVYWIGLAGEMLAEEGFHSEVQTDFNAIADGYVSITPLQMDATSHGTLASVQEALSGRQS